MLNITIGRKDFETLAPGAGMRQRKARNCSTIVNLQWLIFNYSVRNVTYINLNTQVRHLEFDVDEFLLL